MGIDLFLLVGSLSPKQANTDRGRCSQRPDESDRAEVHGALAGLYLSVGRSTHRYTLPLVGGGLWNTRRVWL